MQTHSPGERIHAPAQPLVQSRLPQQQTAGQRILGPRRGGAGSEIHRVRRHLARIFAAGACVPPSCTRVTPNYSACAQNNSVETRPLRNDIAGAIIQTMNTATKLLNAMRQNPNDWVMAKLLSVAKQHGLEVRSTGGSHHVFSHPQSKTRCPCLLIGPSRPFTSSDLSR